MKKSVIGLLLVFLLIFSAEAIGRYWEKEYDVPYVPTPNDVVEEMLKIANVNENDILYDLGCGDGRIVITAAKKLGTHGIGIDINPQRIEESKENAVKAEVTDKVQFIEQNLFDADISKATVVTLYLLSSVNLKLRPILLHDLKPGTRVVSHDFDMGEWKSDKYIEVYDGNSYEGNSYDDYYSHNIYFWVIPANVTGTWVWNMSSGPDTESYVLKLRQEFQNVQGIFTVGAITTPLKDAMLTGDRLHFTIDKKVNGQIVTMQFDGRVSGDSVEGIVKSKTGLNVKKSNWKAKREPYTITPLEK